MNVPYVLEKMYYAIIVCYVVIVMFCRYLLGPVGGGGVFFCLDDVVSRTPIHNSVMSFW